MKKIIIANWKMNPLSLKVAVGMVEELKRGVAKKSKGEVIICPPLVYLADLARLLKGSKIKLGAQNCFWEEKGSFTGEIAPMMLKDIGARYVILGHSERRRIMAETTEQVNQKIKAVLNNGLTPVVCFGESLEEKEQEKSFVSIEKELKEMIEKISKEDITKIVFAYEPDWAIGTGDNCSADDALSMALFVEKLIGEVYNRKIGQAIRILYGGSVTSKNALSYLENEAIDGLLVGGASLKIKEFLKIC
jgi:triosephosphate isomerase